MLNVALDRATAMIVKNQYLLWDSSQLAYFRFTEVNFLQDFYRNKSAIFSNISSSS